MLFVIPPIFSQLEKRSSVIEPADWASRQNTTSEASDSRTLEERMKQNFEAGRLELDRRRKAQQEEQEKIAVSGCG